MPRLRMRVKNELKVEKRLKRLRIKAEKEVIEDCFFFSFILFINLFVCKSFCHRIRMRNKKELDARGLTGCWNLNERGDKGNADYETFFMPVKRLQIRDKEELKVENRLQRLRMSTKKKMI